MCIIHQKYDSAAQVPQIADAPGSDSFCEGAHLDLKKGKWNEPLTLNLLSPESNYCFSSTLLYLIQNILDWFAVVEGSGSCEMGRFGLIDAMQWELLYQAAALGGAREDSHLLLLLICFHFAC